MSLYIYNVHRGIIILVIRPPETRQYVFGTATNIHYPGIFLQEPTTVRSLNSWTNPTVPEVFSFIEMGLSLWVCSNWNGDNDDNLILHWIYGLPPQSSIFRQSRIHNLRTCSPSFPSWRMRGMTTTALDSSPRKMPLLREFQNNIQ